MITIESLQRSQSCIEELKRRPEMNSGKLSPPTLSDRPRQSPMNPSKPKSQRCHGSSERKKPAASISQPICLSRKPVPESANLRSTTSRTLSRRPSTTNLPPDSSHKADHAGNGDFMCFRLSVFGNDVKTRSYPEIHDVHQGKQRQAAGDRGRTFVYCVIPGTFLAVHSWSAEDRIPGSAASCAPLDGSTLG